MIRQSSKFAPRGRNQGKGPGKLGVVLDRPLSRLVFQTTRVVDVCGSWQIRDKMIWMVNKTTKAAATPLVVSVRSVLWPA
jgi:hypothetical protein